MKNINIEVLGHGIGIDFGFIGAGKFEKSVAPCNEIQRIGVAVQDTDFNVTKIMSGKDLDINLGIPFILESWFTNGKQYQNTASFIFLYFNFNVNIA